MSKHKTRAMAKKNQLCPEFLPENPDIWQISAEAVQLMISIVDEFGNCHFCNSYLRKLIGLSPSPRKRFNWAEIIHPEDRSQFQENYITARDRRQEFKIEYRLKVADGNYRWVSATGVPKTNKNNRLYYINSALDITAQKEADAALENNQNFRQPVVENTTHSVSAQDLEGRYILINKAANNTIELSPEEIIAKNSDRLVPPAIAEKVEASDRQTTDKIEEKTYVTGQTIWCKEAVKPVGIYGSSRELSCQLQVDKLADESTYNIWKIVTELIPEAFLVKDIHGRYVIFNSAAATLTGKSPEEIIGKDDREIFPPEIARQLMENDREIMTTGNPQIFEEITSDGNTVRTYLSRKNPWYDPEGNIIGIVGLIQDITESKRQEAALKQQARILDQLCDAVITTDLNGIVNRWNKAAEYLYGYTAEEAIGRSVTFIYLPEQQDFFPQHILPVLQQQGVYEGELTVVHKQGNHVEVLVNISLEKNEAGEVVGLIGYAIDITERNRLEKERQQQEAALRESEERFRAISEQAAVGIAFTGVDGKFLWINQKFCDLTGYTKEKILELKYQEISHPDDAEGDREFLAKFMAGENVKPREKRFIRKDGSTVWVSVTLSLVRDEAGVDKYEIAIVEDISDRKTLEQELALRQARFDAFFSESPAGMAILDEQLRFVQINPTLAQTNGFSVAEHIGKTYSEIQPTAAQTVEPIFRQILTTDKAIINCEGSGANPRFPGIAQHWVASFFPLPDREGEAKGIGIVAVDISERKQAELALREREEFLASIYDGVEQMIFVLDVLPNGEIRYAGWNQMTERLTGISSQKLLHKTTAELFPPAVATSMHQHHMDCLKAGTAISYEECVTLFNSNVENWWNTTLTPLRDNKGRIYRIVGTSIEITKRKQTEDALRKSEEMYRTLVENFPDGAVYLFDRDCRFLIAGGTVLEKLGIKSADLEGKTPLDIWLPENHQAYEPFYTAALAGEIAIGETFYQDVTYFTQSVPVRNCFDEIFAGLLIVKDITDRKRAEQVLIESANRLELLNKITSHIRASLDLDTILETVVVNIRDLFEVEICTFSWYRLDENVPVWDVVQEALKPGMPSFIGLYPASLFAPLTEKILQLEILRIDDAELETDFRLRQNLLAYNCLSMLIVPFQTQKGRIATLSCCQQTIKRPWQDSELELLNSVVANLAIAIDQAELYKQSQISAKIASERAAQLEQALQKLQRTQTQLIQSEKMSSLGQLVAGVAHEINNPVSFIYGNVNPAREYISDLLNLVKLYQTEYPHPTPAIAAEIEAIELDFLVEDLPKLLDSMKIGAERIREIVLSLRNFSRMDEAQIKDVNIHEGIDSTLRLLQNRLKAKPDRPEIIIEKNYRKLPPVECYAGQLNQVFMNLLSNAIDALEERDKLRKTAETIVNPSTIQITTSVVGNHCIAVIIADNGPGIPDSVRSRIFDPFFTTKGVGKGTGLGLAISYQIVVEKHFGRLRCHSVRGQGTEFIMEIPIKQNSKLKNT